MVDLVCLGMGRALPVWKLGAVTAVAPEPAALARELGRLADSSEAAAVLVWDPVLGAPDPELVRALAASQFDCCHAGLNLDMGGLPGVLRFITPTWMLACDAPQHLESTSWRLSFRACLLKLETLRKLGGPNPEFSSLAGAALEMGHRWIRRGALMRHLPSLLPGDAPGGARLPFEDEVRFAYYRYGKKWAQWALWRSLCTGHASLGAVWKAGRTVFGAPKPNEPQPLQTPPPDDSPVDRQARVTVLIPTVDRYPYLRTLLGQLRQQTIRPIEIIVVDQTAVGRRLGNLAEDFSDLPLRVIVLDQPGQCSSRNAGLRVAQGDYLLLLDDDVEVAPDLIEQHLRTLAHFAAEASSGVAKEAGTSSLPADFRLLKISDVFPAGNSLVKRSALQRSGLFDMAYDRGQRADGDLGIRIYLTGGLMVLNPAISVFHHHAPSGGLRKHKARAVTYAMSRRSVVHRALASVSDLYLAERYFRPAHLSEVLWLNLLGTFSIHGGTARHLAKIVVSALLLPHSIRQLRRRVTLARQMRVRFPQIPSLS